MCVDTWEGVLLLIPYKLFKHYDLGHDPQKSPNSKRQEFLREVFHDLPLLCDSEMSGQEPGTLETKTGVHCLPNQLTHVS